MLEDVITCFVILFRFVDQLVLLILYIIMNKIKQRFLPKSARGARRALNFLPRAARRAFDFLARAARTTANLDQLPRNTPVCLDKRALFPQLQDRSRDPPLAFA